jgi:hypothetical protein
VASLLGSKMQADAASGAASAQTGAAQAGIAEQRRQFDAMQALLKPYMLTLVLEVLQGCNLLQRQAHQP